jgi:hypothetical protein
MARSSRMIEGGKTTIITALKIINGTNSKYMNFNGGSKASSLFMSRL